MKLFVERYFKAINLIIAREQIPFAVSFIELKLELDEPIKFKDLRRRHLLGPLAHLLNLYLTVLAVDFVKIMWCHIKVVLSFGLNTFLYLFSVGSCYFLKLTEVFIKRAVSDLPLLTAFLGALLILVIIQHQILSNYILDCQI